MVKAKPFIKWVGGKTQLIEQLEAQHVEMVKHTLNMIIRNNGFKI